MTLVSDLIQQAYREGNIIPAGKQPTTDEQAEALSRFNSLMSSFFGFGMGEPLEDWIFPSPQRTAAVAANFPQLPMMPAAPDLPYVTPYPPKNTRIVWGAVTGTIWFPEKPNDGSRMAFVHGSGAGDGGAAGSVLTLDGNGRLIDGAPTLQLAYGAAAQQWLYRADLGQWITFKPLALTDDCPFMADLDDLWIGLLAMRLAGRYNKQLSPETLAAIKRMQAVARARFHQDVDTQYRGADIPRSWQSYGTSWGWWL